jgi:hypothetical protein
VFAGLALLRFLLCLHAGRRTNAAGGLILTAVVLLLGGILFGGISILNSGWPAPASLPAETSHSILDLTRPQLLNSILTLIAVTGWVDLSNWTLVRFWTLPKVQL